jgi:DNA-binding response OmpR family regulator
MGLTLSKTIRVLVVDDSKIARRWIIEALSHDHEIEVVGVASDPYEARDQILALNPDVITLDLEMPRMNGLEMVRALRADAQLRGVPVIMITSRASEKHRRLALEVGVDAFLTKPYTEDELAAEIRACLERHPALG